MSLKFIRLPLPNQFTFIGLHERRPHSPLIRAALPERPVLLPLGRDLPALQRPAEVEALRQVSLRPEEAPPDPGGPERRGLSEGQEPASLRDLGGAFLLCGPGRGGGFPHRSSLGRSSPGTPAALTAGNPPGLGARGCVRGPLPQPL